MQSTGFLRTLKALPFPGWNSTKEKLPNSGDEVLYRTAEHQAMGRYLGMNQWLFSNGEIEDGAVILWQPL